MSLSRSRAPFVVSWWLTAGVVDLPSLSARWPNSFASLTHCGLTTTFQVVSGLACVVCGLLQGVQDPALQTLQVRKTRKSYNYSFFLSCACLSWASLGLPSPSSSSTCTLPNSSPQPWGTRRLESAPWLPGCSSSSPWCSWYNPPWNSDKSTFHLVVHVVHGNQDRRHHCPASRPHQSLLASCACLHHGSDCYCGEQHKLTYMRRRTIIVNFSRPAS